MRNTLARMYQQQLQQKQDEEYNPFVMTEENNPFLSANTDSPFVAKWSPPEREPQEGNEPMSWWDKKMKKLAAPHGPKWRSGLGRWFGGLGNYLANQ